MSHTQDPLFERIGNDYMKETKHCAQERNLDQLLVRLEEVFGTRADVIEFESLKRWQTFKRNPGESIPAFFVRWKAGMRVAYDYECLENPAALYIKCLMALSLNTQHQQTIDMLYKTWKTLNPSKSPTYLELKEWTQWMEEQQKGKGVSLDILVEDKL